MDIIKELLKQLLGKKGLMGEVINDIYKAQMGKKSNDDDSAKMIFEIIKKGGINPLSLISGSVSSVYNAVVEELTQQSKLLSDINTKTGISGELSEKLRDDMIAASQEAARYGFNLSNIGDLYTTLVGESGKFSLINQKIIETILPVASSLDMTLPEIGKYINDFEDVGIGLDGTIKSLDGAIKKTLTLGMSGKKVVETMTSNIGKLNEYGFKNGVKGLEEMSRKALEFRMAMNTVFNVADKVFDMDNAIDFTANMQVLGGVLGDFNDPLKLMYMATNNVEGLQSAITDAAMSLVTYNKEQGRFQVIGENLRRGKEMAQQMGISLSELSKIGVAAAERVTASSDLMSRGFQMEEKEKEFLLNISRMNNGRMEIVVPQSLQDELGGTPIKLDMISKDQMTYLINHQKAFEKLDTKDIAMAQLTETQQMARGINVIASYYKIQASQLLKGTASGGFGEDMKALKSSIDSFKLKVDPQNYKKIENDAKQNGIIQTLKENTINSYSGSEKEKFFKSIKNKTAEQINTFIDRNFSKSFKKKDEEYIQVLRSLNNISQTKGDMSEIKPIGIADIQKIYQQSIENTQKSIITPKDNTRMANVEYIQQNIKAEPPTKDEKKLTKPQENNQKTEHYVKVEHIYRSEALLDGFSREAQRNASYNPIKYVTDNRDFTNMPQYEVKT